MEIAASVLKVLLVVTTLALLANWVTVPPTLALADATSIEGRALVVSHKGRKYLRLTSGSAAVEVDCSTLPISCRDSSAVPTDVVQAEVVYTGFLGGEWISRATVGGKPWITIKEQEQRFSSTKSALGVATLFSSALLLLVAGYDMLGKRNAA